MPYQTGTAASFAALKTEIFSFLASNGWTQETDIIKRNGVFAKITTGTTGHDGDNFIQLEGGKGSDGAGNLVAKHDLQSPLNNNAGQMSASFGLGAANAMVFPITYHFHLASSPVDEFWCVIRFNGDRCQHMGFGNINKSAPFVGGAFFSCTTMAVSNGGQDMYNWNATNIIDSSGVGSTSANPLEMIPFHGGDSNNYNHVFAGSVVHAEVGGGDWYFSNKVESGSFYPSGQRYMISGKKEHGEMQLVSESAINNVPVLIPFNLRIGGYDDNHQHIGVLENIRFAQIGGIDFGQVESDGTDSWKFYPVYLKDADNPAGGDEHTGIAGLAIRYDGP